MTRYDEYTFSAEIRTHGENITETVLEIQGCMRNQNMQVARDSGDILSGK